jgi:flagellar basal-body rod protein FlgB
MSDLFDKTTRALGASVNLRQVRNNVISSNIANAETPGYQAKKVDFEEALSRALDLEGIQAPDGLTEGHYPVSHGSLSRVKADIYENPDVNVANDGNTVDLEKEMSSLAENSIMYKAAIQLINKKMAALKYAVSEGGR